MSDQNIPTDWKDYFAKLKAAHIAEHGRELLSNIADFSPQFVGPARPFVVYMKDKLTGDLDYADVESFDEAREIYQDNGGPEMWFFWSTGSAPWHCPALPKVKQQGKAQKEPRR
jgi:hypothetical protein